MVMMMDENKKVSGDTEVKDISLTNDSKTSEKKEASKASRKVTKARAKSTKTSAAYHKSQALKRHELQKKKVGAAPLPKNYPYKKRMPRAQYEIRKEELQIELLKVQNWVKSTGQRILCVFEGRDAAGKGGTIKRFTEHLNPRGARVVALEKPTDEERGQWYFQRYTSQLPTRGEIVFFDRS